MEVQSETETGRLSVHNSSTTHYCARRAIVVHEEHPHWLTALRNASFLHSFTRRTHGRLRQEGSPGLLGHFNNNLRRLEMMRPSYAPPPAQHVELQWLIHSLRYISLEDQLQLYPCASPLFQLPK